MVAAWRVLELEEADPTCLMASSLAEEEAAMVVMEDTETRCEYEKMEGRGGCAVTHGREFHDYFHELDKRVIGD